MASATAETGKIREIKMKSRTIFAVVAVLILGSIGYGQKMIVDADKSVNFAAFKSFAWAEGNIAPKATTSQLIIAAIEKELTSRGLVKNEAAPDIRIAVMAAADMDLQGIGPTWNNEAYRSWGGYGNPAAMMTVTKGTLLVDILEVNNKTSVWRGVAKDIFVQTPSGNAEKDAKQMEKLVNKTVGDMFKQYPVKAK